MPTLLLFPASLRQQSHQRRLVNHFAALLHEKCDVDIVGPEEVTLPMYNEDLESDPAVAAHVRALFERFARADGFIIASPEYNGHIPPYLKNTVDWLSRIASIDPAYRGRSPFVNKPVMLASASTGWTGGVLGLQNVRSVFAYLGCLVAPRQLTISNVERFVVGDEYKFVPHYVTYIRNTLDEFLALLQRRQPA